MAASLIIGGGVAALAAATPALAARRERAIDAAYPPIGQMVMVEGQRVHALTMGHGPDVVLIHGASGNLRDLLPLMESLAPRYRVTAFDRPGMGWSDPIAQGTGLTAQALHMAKAAKALGLTRPVLVGQSYGGSVALAWALAGALSPRALVLVSAPSLPWPGLLDPWYRLTATTAGQRLAIPFATAFLPDAYLTAATRAIFAPNPVPPGYAETIGAALALRRSALRTNTAQINALRPQIVAQAAHYAGLDLPVELVHGDADTIVPLRIHSAPLAGIVPGARLTVLAGMGHMPHHSATAQVVAAIDRADAQT